MDFVGFDTETISGKCRLIGLSTGEHFNIGDNLSMIFTLLNFHNTNFVAYNADYDIQSILAWLPEKELDYIIRGLEVEYLSVKFLYYKRKFLKFNSNWIFDVYQYYQAGTLAKCAEKYLHRKKHDVDASKITEENIYSKKIIEYCINDAKLAYELMVKMYNVLPKELQGTKPISTAYYSAKYFKKELFENRISNDINITARKAYHGGRFEILSKGHFGGTGKNGKVDCLYNYDIVSAYPYEICKLKSMKRFNVVWHKGYIADATYGIYHVKVDITDKFISPLVYKFKGLCYYPVGHYDGIITKNEFEHIREYDHEILAACHIFPGGDTPFKERMEKVFYRKCNDENRIVWKYLANSLYGKCCQATKKYVDEPMDFDTSVIDTIEKDGKYYYKIEDIDKSNFVYASEITANTRLKVFDVIKKYREKVLAVQTDSIVSTVPLDLEIDKNKLGAWTVQKWDEAFLVGSGVYFYRIEKIWYAKFRGFNFSGTKVEEILEKVLTSDKLYIDFDILKRISIQESKRIHDIDMANVIVNATRKLNINFDKKRIWSTDWKNGKELEKVQISSLAIFLKS